MTAGVWVEEPFDARRVIGATGLLGAFNEAGVVLAGELHVARRLGALAGEEDETVLLAAALAVRAPRLGHVFVDLSEAAQTTTIETEEPVDVAALPWPEVTGWAEAVARSPLTATGDDDRATTRPLRLVGTHLYLDRYWREELRLADDLRSFGVAAEGVDEAALEAGLARLFPGAGPGDHQRLAAATALRRRLCVIAGGPGTGKTTTVARVVALLLDQAAARGDRAPLIALAAPTGKAAARLEEALHEQVDRLDVDGAAGSAMLGLSASTLHRLLGWRPGGQGRFRHHRGNRLPHDVVIVDETSMVSLTMMGRLVEAVRSDARLVLVGDPGQLTSIEAGAVLGDVVGPAREDAAAGAQLGIVVLHDVHRYGGGIADLASAVDAGDADEVVRVLRTGEQEVLWLEVDAAEADAATLAPVREAAVEAAADVLAAARRGEAHEALGALGAFRLLCAHRRGPYGAAQWMATVERWLADHVEGFLAEGEWYVGRPLLVTENDYGLKLYNGDTGVVVTAGSERVAAAFERHGQVVSFPPTRLHAVDTVYAMTIHKSQGSQFTTAAIVLPPESSPILTRELLYTGATRASEQLIVVGTEASVRAAVARPAARASGLRERLWS